MFGLIMTFPGQYLQHSCLHSSRSHTKKVTHSFTVWAQWIVALLSWNMPSGKKKHPLMEKPGHSVYSGSQLTYFFGHITLLTLELNQSQIITLAPQACTVSTRHDGCITSSASLLTIILPSLWNRVNLDSSDHMTFSHCSNPISMLPSKLKPFCQVASLKSGGHTAV